MRNHLPRQEGLKGDKRVLLTENLAYKAEPGEQVVAIGSYAVTCCYSLYSTSSGLRRKLSG